MRLTNNLTEYGAISKIFHWLSAAVLIIQIPLGFYLVDLDFSEKRLTIESIHVILGLSLFYLTLFRLTYKLLNGSRNTRYFKPCFKHYLLEHVKSRFAEVSAPEWEIATFLPMASWQKSSAGRIYSDSRKIANGQ